MLIPQIYMRKFLVKLIGLKEADICFARRPKSLIYGRKLGFLASSRLDLSLFEPNLTTERSNTSTE